jgi:predicted GNAT family acetyltransferase
MFNSTPNSFYLGEDPQQPLAEINFIPTGENELSITHTYVSDILRGQGMGRKLVDAVADLARAQGNKLSATCTFAAKVLLEDAKYADIIK